MTDDADPAISLTSWSGPWADDDPHANFKDDVAAYRLLDPLETIRGVSEATGIPEGALARYVLAKWATGGSEGMMHTGSSTIERMWAACERAEAAGTDEARLNAYEQLRHIVSWLRVPFEDPTTSGS